MRNLQMGRIAKNPYPFSGRGSGGGRLLAEGPDDTTSVACWLRAGRAERSRVRRPNGRARSGPRTLALDLRI